MRKYEFVLRNWIFMYVFHMRHFIFNLNGYLIKDLKYLTLIQFQYGKG